MKKIGFIGCGNMGGALARAVAKAVGGDALLLADLNADKAQALAEELGAAVADADRIAREAYLIVIGVKPQVLTATLAPLQSVLAARGNGFTLLSMAAGTPIAKIAEAAGGEYPILRIMPNLPASVGEGMILYCKQRVDATAEAFFRTAFDKAGVLDEIAEKDIDAAAALSGCGPAFVCLFAEALADAGVSLGLTREKAALYAAQTLKGTAVELLETGVHPEALKDAVCSPGGTTIAGVQALEKGAFRAATQSAVIAAFEKTKKL
ncbi:MAG: pyrroline-5-carboxylate reductase [Clostridia bacterium]|nr:pyrroline-5-carboxylate reductase [Clostridia bacterium]